MSGKAKWRLAVAYDNAHERFQTEVAAAAGRLARKLSRIYDKEFTLEAKTVAKKLPPAPKSRRTRPPTGKPNVPPRILADVPADKIEAVQGVFQLEHGDAPRIKRSYKFSGKYTQAAIAARQVGNRARARLRKAQAKAADKSAGPRIRW